MCIVAHLGYLRKSIMSKDVPACAIVAGIPAKLVGHRQWDEEKQEFRAIYHVAEGG